MTAKLSFSSQEKLDIINEGMQPGANVKEICRRHGISTSLYPVNHPSVVLRHKLRQSRYQPLEEATNTT